MARLHIPVPAGGRIDTEYLETVYEKLNEKLTTKAPLLKFQDE